MIEEIEDITEIVIEEPTEEEIEVEDNPIGQRGYSAYEVYLNEGGTLSKAEWLASLKGEKGQDGKDGVDGKDYVITESDYNSIADITKTKIDIPDVSNFITKSVNDLTNYYLKSQTYTQEEVNNLISAIPKFNILVVSELPTSNISTTTIYLKTSGEEEPNLYKEYIYVNNKWELLGSQSVDLSQYAKKSELPTKTSDLTNDSNFLTEHQTLKTINSQSIVGSGNITIEGGGGNIHVGTDTPTDDSEVWINPEGTPDTIPTKTSQLTNDSGFITNSYHDSSKQDTLVSGNNVKTINNQSILGSGNITIEGGSSDIKIITDDDLIDLIDRKWDISSLEQGIYKFNFTKSNYCIPVLNGSEFINWYDDYVSITNGALVISNGYQGVFLFPYEDGISGNATILCPSTNSESNTATYSLPDEFTKTKYLEDKLLYTLVDLVGESYEWEQDTEYNVDDLVYVTQRDWIGFYKCITAHTSSSIFSFDEDKWELFGDLVDKLKNMPTKTSDLTNDSGFTTENDVKTIVDKDYLISIIGDGREETY